MHVFYDVRAQRIVHIRGDTRVGWRALYTVCRLYKGDTVQPRQSALGQVGTCAPHGITHSRNTMEKKTARSRLRGAERTHHTDMGPAPSRSVTCPLLRPSTRHALMAERVTTCSCIHRHGKSVLVLHLCRRDHARSCLCVPAVALRRLCSCSGVAVERRQCQSILGDAM